MEDAIAAISGSLNSNSESFGNQIAQLFKSHVHTDDTASPYPDYSKWVRIMFSEPKTIMTAFVANLCENNASRRRMGSSYICATETSADPNLASDCIPLSHPSGGW